MKIGDGVEWVSQANGSEKKKTGIIVGVVPPGRRIGLLNYVAGENVQTARDKFNTRLIDGGGLARNHESYLVAVRTGKTDAAKMTLYWPRVSSLRPLSGVSG